jgi:D-arginine dehydrogenase
VMLLEAEAQPGYHTTGRSNAFWHETYGGPHVQPLTSASLAWLQSPPPHISDRGFLSPRGALTIARDEDHDALARFVSDFAGSAVALASWDRPRLEAAVPGLRAPWRHAIYEADCHDIDVAGFHAAALRHFRRSGGTIATNAALRSAVRTAGRWQLDAGGEAVTTAILVNAAGAWADAVARLADVAPIGIQPYRRTIVQLETIRPVSPETPFLIDVNGGFYFKPESGRIWLSPHDETASPACDAAPDELDIAIAIDHFEKTVDWGVKRLEHSWAGLRSFAADRLPVYGFDPDSEGFFWCVGQGGFGIQTAPAAAKLTACLLTGEVPDPMISGIDPAPYAPGRFRD